MVGGSVIVHTLLGHYYFYIGYFLLQTAFHSSEYLYIHEYIHNNYIQYMNIIFVYSPHMNIIFFLKLTLMLDITCNRAVYAIEYEFTKSVQLQVFKL